MPSGSSGPSSAAISVPAPKPNTVNNYELDCSYDEAECKCPSAGTIRRDNVPQVMKDFIAGLPTNRQGKPMLPQEFVKPADKRRDNVCLSSGCKRSHDWKQCAKRIKPADLAPMMDD
ncbi:TPA: hypothetical protein ACH3X1_001282 [Trebouxia sp. C0004]